MLISHRKEFIFTKTQKTAGTSIESYFERYCMFDGEWEEAHFRDTYSSDAGIIGYRGFDRGESKWFNHMSAEAIRDLIGQQIWDRYFKFTVIRNPFDKMISGFSMLRFRNENSTFVNGLKKQADRESSKGSHNEKKVEIDAFRKWVQSGGAFIDRATYIIKGEECLDFFVRFENLHEDLMLVCKRLDIRYEPKRLPQFKKGYRYQDIPIAEFYDKATIDIITEKFAWELERFGYTLPKIN